MLVAHPSMSRLHRACLMQSPNLPTVSDGTLGAAPQVGDYILSPEVCVERKSLADLRQSFASGRLYHQAEAMCRHYAAPVLLIEFERDRAFALHAASELGSDPQARPCVYVLLHAVPCLDRCCC